MKLKTSRPTLMLFALFSALLLPPPARAEANEIHSSLLLLSLRWQAVHFARFQLEMAKQNNYFHNLSPVDQRRFHHLNINPSQLDPSITSEQLSEVQIARTQCRIIAPANILAGYQPTALCECPLSEGGYLAIHFSPNETLGLNQFSELTEHEKLLWLYAQVLEKPVRTYVELTP